VTLDIFNGRLPSPGGKSALFPVVLRVPQYIRELPMAQRVKALGVLARESACLSARLTDVTIGEFKKGGQGQPLSWGGVHWSVTHKPCHVAGVVSLCPVGIDIERVKPVSWGLFHRICSEREVALFPDHPREIIFFRCFTAKEAVLKLFGKGLTGLNDVSVVDVSGALHLGLSYKDVFIRVEHCMIGEHLASIAGIRTHVVWTRMPGK